MQASGLLALPCIMRATERGSHAKTTRRLPGAFAASSCSSICEVPYSRNVALLRFCGKGKTQNMVFYWDNDDRFKPSTLLTVLTGLNKGVMAVSVVSDAWGFCGLQADRLEQFREKARGDLSRNDFTSTQQTTPIE